MATVQRHLGFRKDGPDQLTVLGKISDVLAAIMGDDKSDNWTLSGMEARIGRDQTTTRFQRLSQGQQELSRENIVEMVKQADCYSDIGERESMSTEVCDIIADKISAVAINTFCLVNVSFVTIKAYVCYAREVA